MYNVGIICLTIPINPPAALHVNFNLLQAINYIIVMNKMGRAETNIQFARIFARLHKYSNAKKVFRYTENDFSAVFLTYFVINYKF